MASTAARMMVQMMLVGFNIVTKAAMQAYQQAKAGGGGAAAGAMRSAAAMGGSRMAADEARAILALESAGSKLDMPTMLAQFNKYYTANDPANGGSFYIQSKIWNAKEMLTEEARRAAAAAAASAAAGDAAGGASSSGGRTGGRSGGRMA